MKLLLKRPANFAGLFFIKQSILLNVCFFTYIRIFNDFTVDDRPYF